MLDPETGKRIFSTTDSGGEVPLGTTEMAALAAQRAMVNANVLPDGVDMLITNSTTPDTTLPPFTLLLQKRLGIREVQCIDLRGGCSASIQALSIATLMVESGRARTVLLVGSECTSPFYFTKLRTMTNPSMTDILNGTVFADGSGAIVVQRRNDVSPSVSSSMAIRYAGGSSCFPEKSPGFLLLNREGGGIETKHNHRAIRHTLPQVVARAYSHLAKNTGRNPSDYDVTVIPQVNRSMIEMVLGDGMRLLEDGLCYFGEETGNVPAAAMFMAIDMAKQRNRLPTKGSIGVVSVETTSWNFAVADLEIEGIL